jgi:uncharacterized membrane protein YbhN (UPF0104 family)
MADTSPHARRNRKLQWLYVVVCLVGLYGIVPQLSDFRHGFALWRHINEYYLGALIISCCLTYFAASATYKLLAFKRLRYSRTLLVEVASMFINRLLPGGLGGIGANYDYLRKSKLTASEASATVATNNSLGFIGHVLLVGSVILFKSGSFKNIHLPHVGRAEALVAIVVVIVTGLGFKFIPNLTNRIEHSFGAFIKQLARFRSRKLRLLFALLTSICLTLSCVSGVWFSCLAIGIHLSFFIILIVFTLGVGVGTITPTPGGIGGVEAGMVAGLVAYHESAASALAVVLLYRLVSFWLALIVGASMFVIVKKRNYL